MTAPILAAGTWSSNAELIADCAALGYLRADWLTLDPTYGLGRFWAKWRPEHLVYSDIDPRRSWSGISVDFTGMPWPDALFDAVVFDGPYKLNGTAGSVSSDADYGVAETSTWQDRHALIRDGMTECHRVLKPTGTMLVKCQDQVSSGRVRWQTLEFSNHGIGLGMRLVDMLLFPSYRPQPPSRRQVHARRNYSSLLVFRKAS